MARVVTSASALKAAQAARREEVRLLLAAAGVLSLFAGLFVITLLILGKGIYDWNRLWPPFVPFLCVGVVLLVAGAFLTSRDVKEMGFARLFGGGGGGA